MESVLEKAAQSAIYVKKYISDAPDVAIILGSGLGGLADEIRDKVIIPYEEIPNFGKSEVAGHSNKLIYGTIYGKKVIAMQGRFHYYEGYTMQEISLPVKVFALLGVDKLIVSNAAGAINKKFKVGDLMLITDHIKLTGESPLRGPNIEGFGERFCDMSEPYSNVLINLTKELVKQLKFIPKVDLHEGVYAFMPGPQYETKAELKMLEIMGADAVGMSTVPEVIAAVHAGMDVLGISCITNVTGAGKKVNHEEVIEATEEIEYKFKMLIMEVIRNI